MTAGWVLQELTLSETLHAVLPGLARLSTLTDLRALRLTKVHIMGATQSACHYSLLTQRMP